jgi:hypothetical protein
LSTITTDRAPARGPDVNKSPTANAIREKRALLTITSLRRLRERLFKLELELLEQMVTGGIDIPRVTALSHCARAIEVVDVLQTGARGR